MPALIIIVAVWLLEYFGAGGVQTAPLCGATLLAGLGTAVVLGLRWRTWQGPPRLGLLLGAGLLALWVGLLCLHMPDRIADLSAWRRDLHEPVREMYQRLAQAGLAVVPPQPSFSLSLNPSGSQYFLVVLLGSLFLGWLASTLDSTQRRWLYGTLGLLALLVAVHGTVTIAKCIAGPGRWFGVPTGKDSGLLGCFYNPNHFSGYLAMLLPLVIVLGVRAWKQGSFWGTGLWVLTGLAILVAVPLSLARGGLLLLGAGGFLLATAWGGYRHPQRLLGGLAIGAILLLLLVAFQPGGLLSDVSTAAIVSESRPKIWRWALLTWSHSPWVGIGPCSFDAINELYRDASLGLEKDYLFAESTYLELLLGLGLCGLPFVLGLAVAFGRAAGHRLRSGRLDRDERAALLAGLGVALLHGIWDFPGLIPFYAATVAVLAGVLISPGRRELQSSRPVAPWRRLAPIAAALAGVLLVLAIYRGTGNRLTATFEPSAHNRQDLPGLLQALAERPGAWDAWYALGRYDFPGLSRQQRLDLRIACYRRAVALAPRHDLLRVPLAIAYLQQGDRASAEALVAEQRQLLETPYRIQCFNYRWNRYLKGLDQAMTPYGRGGWHW